MEKYGYNGWRVFGGAVALVVVAAGAILVFYALFGGGPPVSASPPSTPPREIAPADPTPADETMRLTVPRMERVENVPVFTAPADDTATLDRGALHVEGTGFPWESGANVYIAGHRLGYPDTGSYLQFYDLDKLQNGDEIILTDANGTRYTYEVFRSFLANPGDYHVTEPVPGKSVVSLQTCTLPDYSQRLIVQAELKNTN